MNAKLPFLRVEHVQRPEIIGARWWQEQVASGADPVARRSALIGLTALGLLIAGAGASCVMLTSSSTSDTQTTTQEALLAQKQFGWNIGAGTETLTFDGASTEPFDRAALDTLVDDLGPKSASLRPYYVPTLFQSVSATPTTPANLDPFKPLKEIIQPVHTAAMKVAFLQGRAMSSLFEGAPAGRAVIVDLPGALAVAFAAGLADRLDVVFGLDGWPHPQGVVPAHQTLGAAAYYQRLFAKLKDERPASAAPAFVLDRGRMLPYSDESDRFDNRYLAKVPDSAQLKALGVKQVFYVSEDGYVEADDLNEDFLAYSSAGLELRLIKPEDFGPDPTEPAAAPTSDGGAPRASDGGAGGSGSSYGYGYDGSHYYYGSRSYSHWYFWSYHGWGTPTRSYRPFTGSMLRSRYTPSARTTNYRGVGTGMSKSRPSGFGTIGIVSSGSGSSRRTVGTTRSGSWGRSSGTSGS